MSHLTADTLMPLISALPEDQLHLLREKLNKMAQKKDRPKRKKPTTREKVAAQLGPQFLPGNEEMLISEIMNGN